MKFLVNLFSRKKQQPLSVSGEITTDGIIRGVLNHGLLDENFEVLSGEFSGELPKGDKGEKGDRGERGERGDQGFPGQDGQDAQPGRDGKDGADGAPGAAAEADTALLLEFHIGPEAEIPAELPDLLRTADHFEFEDWQIRNAALLDELMS